MKRALIGLVAWAAFVTVAEAQTVGTCLPATADAYLDAGNVRARILNNGNLFYSGEPHVYNVPKWTTSNAVFSAGLWIGGMVDGTLRMAASRYGPYEFWPGPLDDVGNPPADCAEYDRIYTVTKSDVAKYDATGVAVPDLADWPTGLGAPTLDAGGYEIDLSADPLAARRNRRIDLAAGERPAFLGDQMAWWIMNDRGNEHLESEADPVGVEVHGLAFAFDIPGHVGNATFYRYTVVYKGNQALEDAHVALYMDPNLGNFGDNWVGSDSLLGLGYVWNGDNSDTMPNSDPDESYGTPPPALGVDFFQGPIEASPEEVARVGYRSIPGFRNVPLTAFVESFAEGYFPDIAYNFYNLMRGRRRDGKAVTMGGNGYDFSEIRTRFMYSGDASRCAYWTECNTDGAGTERRPGDRRFVASTGPVTLAPGERQEILIGLVYGRGSDHFDSVTALKEADAALQGFVDSWFTEFPTVPAAPTAVPDLISPADLVHEQPLETTLWWECPAGVFRCGVLVASDPRFENVVVVSPRTELSLELKPESRYWWKARAYGRDEIPGPWSEVRSFRTGSTSQLSQFADFQVVANGSGPLDPSECGALGSAGFPLVACGRDRPDGTRQQAGGALTENQGWVIHAGGAGAPFGPPLDPSSFVDRVFRSEWTAKLGAYDYEIRFTSAGGKARRMFQDMVEVDVPFELWRIGRGTPDDPSDDVRLVPFVNDLNSQFSFDIGGDHEVSVGPDDPMTDWIYWNLPADDRPGDAGYRAYFNGRRTVTELMARTVLVCLDCGTSAPYPQPYPEVGTVFRILTKPPHAPILAAPASGPVIRGSDLRFFWAAADGFPVQLQVSTSPGFETFVERIPEAESGMSLRLAEPGEYYWRVGSEFTGWSETWVANVVSLTGTDDAGGVLPTEFALDAIWPNPFNPLATIRFGLPASAAVTVDVVDMLGRRVAVIDAGARRAAGWHTVQFDGSRLASGVYFVRLVAGGRLDVKSVVLLK